MSCGFRGLWRALGQAWSPRLGVRCPDPEEQYGVTAGILVKDILREIL